MGIDKTLNRARGIIFWPGITEAIQEEISSCEPCLENKGSNRKEPMIMHKIPDRAWQELAIDFLQIKQRKWMVTVDYFSSFIELEEMHSTTAGAVISKLKKIFARHGVPERIFTDNGPPFDSYETQEFAKEFNFQIITSSPKYPQSNGKAENAVKIVKNMLKRTKEINTALMEYHATPITALGKSPAELLFGRKIRTKLPIKDEQLNPRDMEGIKEKMLINKQRQKFYYDRNAGPEKQELKQGDKVMIRFDDKSKWRKGEIREKVNPRSYEAEDENGWILRRNRKHLHKKQK